MENSLILWFKDPKPRAVDTTVGETDRLRASVLLLYYLICFYYYLFIDFVYYTIFHAFII